MLSKFACANLYVLGSNFGNSALSVLIVNFFLVASQRMWALQGLRRLMSSGLRKMISIPGESEKCDSALSSLLKGLPQALLRQYEYEDPLVKSGKHLMHSSFFKVLVALACDLGKFLKNNFLNFFLRFYVLNIEIFFRIRFVALFF